MPRKLNGWQQRDLIFREGQQWPAPQPAKFEQLVAQLGITEEEAADNPVVQTWIRAHYWHRFVPEAILRYLQLSVSEKMLGYGDIPMTYAQARCGTMHLGVTQNDSV